MNVIDLKKLLGLPQILQHQPVKDLIWIFFGFFLSEHTTM